MRNLKKLLAVILAVSVMLTAMVPAFAADSEFQYEEQATTLNALEVMSGNAEGDLMLGKALTRAEGVTFALKLIGKTDADAEAAKEGADEVLAKFKDGKDVPNWAKGWVALAVELEVASGSTDGNFYPNKPLLGKDLASYINKALGFENVYSKAAFILADKAKSDVLVASLAADLNGSALTRDLATALVYGALTATAEGEETTVVEALVAGNADLAKVAEDAGLVTPAATIKSVAAPADVELTVGDDAAAKLPAKVTATYTDGKTAEVAVTWATVDTTKAAAKAAVKGTIEGFADGVSINVTVKALAVDFTLSATNFKEVVVTFNQAIDASKLVAANFAVTGNTVTVDSVAADNKSVVLNLGTALTAAGNSAEVTVKAAIAGADTKKTISNITDTGLPSIVSAAADGNSAIKVTFSEPINGSTITNSGEYKLDGQYFSQSAIPAMSGRVLTVVPTSRLAAGEHTLTVTASARDFAGYGIASSRDIKFTVGTDATAATVSFVSATQTQLVVKFSEKINALAASSITFTNGATAGTPTTTDNITWTIPNSGTAFAATGNTTVTFAKAGIVDTFGNVPAADLTLAFVATADTTRPTVTAVEFATDVQNKLYVTYSKEIDVTTGTYTLTETKADNTTATPAVSAAWFVDTTVTPNVTVKTKVVLQLGGAANFTPTSSYALQIRNVDDGPNPLKNKITDYYVAGLKVKDLTAAARTGVSVSGQSMYITFDDVLDASTVVAGNFVYVRGEDSKVVNGIPSGSTVELINSGKTIKLTWPTAVADATNGLNPANIVQIQYTGLKGTDANAITAAVVTKASQGGGIWAAPGTAPSIASAKLTGTNTVVVQLANFSNFIFDPGKALNDIVINNGVPQTITKTSPVYDATTGTITFTTVDTFAKNGTINSLQYTVYTATTRTLVDIYGQTLLAQAGTPLVDKIVPTVVGDIVNTGDHQNFTIDVSEELLDGLNGADFDLTGGTMEFSVVVDGALVPAAAVSYNSTTDKITINLGGAIASGKTFTVTFAPLSASTIKDKTNQNVLAAFTKSYTRP
ncbi:MAG: Ig-like domain-containing protein [Clostridia bacterium]|nr:Ig-like domain-containing protein [Clostridia bacterium]